MIIPAQGSAIAFSLKKLSGCNLACTENCNDCRCNFYCSDSARSLTLLIGT
ncbi:MAG: hypothetical protein V7L04_17180 [Nostoc sp.]|uniref:hypothetical protein n=1 Tax=Nostoc sp. TaxID=1180 RepID=UPI002FF742DA